MVESLDISELFYSLQGESSFVGRPFVFIRLAGCNLRCSYCDARYTYEEAGEDREITEIIEFVEGYPGVPVEVTGGEPLCQEGVYGLLERLLGGGRRVLLETNGSVDLARVPAGVVKIIDIKCPGSGMAESFYQPNLGLLGEDDELKFVLTDRNDYDWAGSFIRQHGLLDFRTMHFSPVADRLDPVRLADWIMADQLPVRLQLQLHKFLWPAVLRGK